MIIYADDLSIKMRLCGNVKVDKILIIKQMAAIQTWMDSNQLVFNGMKTELLVISRKNGDNKDLRLTMKDGMIAPQRSCRMLCLYLTYNLRQDWFISQMKGN